MFLGHVSQATLLFLASVLHGLTIDGRTLSQAFVLGHVDAALFVIRCHLALLGVVQQALRVAPQAAAWMARVAPCFELFRA